MSANSIPSARARATWAPRNGCVRRGATSSRRSCSRGKTRRTGDRSRPRSQVRRPSGSRPARATGPIRCAPQRWGIASKMSVMRTGAARRRVSAPGGSSAICAVRSPRQARPRTGSAPRFRARAPRATALTLEQARLDPAPAPPSAAARGPRQGRHRAGAGTAAASTASSGRPAARAPIRAKPRQRRQAGHASGERALHRPSSTSSIAADPAAGHPGDRADPPGTAGRGARDPTAGRPAARGPAIAGIDSGRLAVRGQPLGGDLGEQRPQRGVRVQGAAGGVDEAPLQHDQLVGPRGAGPARTVAAGPDAAAGSSTRQTRTPTAASAISRSSASSLIAAPHRASQPRVQPGERRAGPVTHACGDRMGAEPRGPRRGRQRPWPRDRPRLRPRAPAADTRAAPRSRCGEARCRRTSPPSPRRPRSPPARIIGRVQRAHRRPHRAPAPGRARPSRRPATYARLTRKTTTSRPRRPAPGAASKGARTGTRSPVAAMADRVGGTDRTGPMPPGAGWGRAGRGCRAGRRRPARAERERQNAGQHLP